MGDRGPAHTDSFGDDSQLSELIEDFHAMHEQIFGIRDPSSLIEFVGWTATARCRLRGVEEGRLRAGAHRPVAGTRTVFFTDIGEVDATLHDFETMEVDVEHRGPAIIESPFTTVVADGETRFRRTSAGSLLMRP